MRNPPPWLVRGGLMAAVIGLSLAGRWLIPSGVGLLPRLVGIAAIIVGVLWLASRIARAIRQRGNRTPG